MESSQINCINSECEWKGDLSSLAAHLRSECMHERYPCKYCNMLISLSHIETHCKTCSKKPMGYLQKYEKLRSENHSLSQELAMYQTHQTAILRMINEDNYNSMASEETSLYLSQVCERCEDYFCMKCIMKALCEKRIKDKEELTTRERDQFSISYKNLMQSLVAAYRTFRGNVNAKEEYTKVISARAKQLVDEASDIVEELLNITNDTNTQIYYYKLEGDMLRYLGNFLSGIKEHVVRMRSKNAYYEAFRLARKYLDPVDPIRLGLLLSYSTYSYDILGDKETAVRIAREAFDKAVEKIDVIPEEKYRDITTIMQMLRDNLCMWTQNDNE